MYHEAKEGKYSALAKNKKLFYAFVAGSALEKKMENNTDLFEKNKQYQQLLQEYSIPRIINKNPKQYPPVFSIHGTDDNLVPYGNTSRLCDAYKGQLLMI